jgi:glycosyltransferase involved in cell wall biosynthesis
MDATLFVSTYEMPHHLALVCAALSRQSARGRFEVIFCDDGSGPETGAIIARFIAQSGIPSRHLRQEHQGFRKCRILNQGLREAHGAVFIFLDGDCVPHRDYVLDHLDHQEAGRFLAGRRVELGPKISASLDEACVREGYFDFPRPSLIFSAVRGETEFLNRSVRWPWAPVRRWLGMERVADMKGCNYSLPRAALEAINGFDEEYEGYGREDTDVELRLQNLGYRIKSLKGLALQFHVWHPRREFIPANDTRIEEVRRTGRVRCERGLVPERSP